MNAKEKGVTCLKSMSTIQSFLARAHGKCRLGSLYIIIVTRLIQHIKFISIEFNFIILIINP
jgi:hypothetical protein